MKILNLLFALLLSNGCHYQSRTDEKILIVGLGNSPSTFDPRMATDANAQRIDDLIFSSLVRNGPDLKPLSQDAESWIISNKKIVFVVKKGLKFQNGKSLQVSDYIYSINEYRRPPSPFASALANIDNIQQNGDRELVLNLKQNDFSLMTTLSDVKALPREIVESEMGSFATHPIGSGPFTLVSFDNSEVVLQKSKSPSYATPLMDKIVFKTVRDDNTRALKILKGDLDILSNELPEEKINELKKSDKVSVLVTPGLNFNYVLLNLNDERLKNPDVRQALFSALKRDEIIKYKLENLGLLATSILAPVNPFSNQDLKFRTLDLEEAKKIISRIGLENSEISLKTSTQATTNGQILAQQFEQTGIKIKLQSFEWGIFYSDIKNGRFQMALMRWVGVVDPDVYRDTLSSHEFPPGKNRGYFSNKRFDFIVNQARTEKNPVKRIKLYNEAQQIIADELPVFPLWYNSNITVLSKRVKNFVPIVTGSFYPMLSVTKD